MLRLKSFTPKQSMSRVTSIYDLPAELFDAIIEQVSFRSRYQICSSDFQRKCISHAPITTTLSTASLVSKRFRQTALVILFQCVDINLTNAPRRHGETLLDFLLHSPHIRECVHGVRFHAVDGETASQDVEYQKLSEVLPLLPNLRQIE
jgi:hypothetical protein